MRFILRGRSSTRQILRGQGLRGFYLKEGLGWMRGRSLTKFSLREGKVRRGMVSARG